MVLDVRVNYTLESVAEDRFRGNVSPHSIRLRDVLQRCHLL